MRSDSRNQRQEPALKHRLLSLSVKALLPRSSDRGNRHLSLLQFRIKLSKILIISYIISEYKRD